METSNRQSTLITVVAIGQIVPALLYPPSVYASISPFILGGAVAIFVVLGIYLIQRRPWAKTLTIFLQGFNIIARIMLLLSNSAAPLKQGGGANIPFIVTGLVAIFLSGLILYRFDVPEIELAFAG